MRHRLTRPLREVSSFASDFGDWARRAHRCLSREDLALFLPFGVLGVIGSFARDPGRCDDWACELQAHDPELIGVIADEGEDITALLAEAEKAAAAVREGSSIASIPPPRRSSRWAISACGWSLKAVINWLPRLATPINPRRMRSFAPSTRWTLAAVNPRVAAAETLVNVRRLILSVMA